ncbi:MAG: inositol monophosphatase family protein, partial [Acidobacteriota bacterium]
VYDPLHNELFSAQKGRGSELNGKKIKVAEVPDMLPSGVSSGILEFAGRHGFALQLMQACGKARILGSQALHLCYVAAGRMRINLNWNCHVWDDAAGVLIVREAGGVYSNSLNAPVFPLKTGDDVLAGKPIRSVAGTPSEHTRILKAAKDGGWW